jgi:hypothetical protein
MIYYGLSLEGFFFSAMSGVLISSGYYVYGLAMDREASPSKILQEAGEAAVLVLGLYIWTRIGLVLRDACFASVNLGSGTFDV